MLGSHAAPPPPASCSILAAACMPWKHACTLLFAVGVVQGDLTDRLKMVDQEKEKKQKQVSMQAEFFVGQHPLLVCQLHLLSLDSPWLACGLFCTTENANPRPQNHMWC